jgi:hypothetical protein
VKEISIRTRKLFARQIRLLVFAAILGSGLMAGSVRSQSGNEELISHARYLASDELMGRAVGTPGIEKARDYIAAEFSKYGLTPGGETNGYLQRLSVTTGVRLAEPSTFITGGSQPLRIQEDWLPLGLSGSGKFAGEVVFAGYGISAKDYGYDDYAGLDVKGKVVLVLRYEPPPKNNDSIFRRGPRYSQHATFNSKINNARSHGAVGLILVDLSSTEQGTAELVPVARSLGRNPSSFVAVQITKQIAEPWFQSRGISLQELRQKIDREERPASALLPGSHVAVEVTLEKIDAAAQNVVGFLPASNPGTKESIVIGAHYDHLGLGYFGSEPGQEGKIHNGADDNASGVAVLLRVARTLSERPERLERNIVFVAFTAEELGLHGSRHYAAHPLFPSEATKAMINLDMVGRMRKNQLTLFGLETAEELRSLVSAAAQGLGIETLPAARGVGRSDHASFYDKNIPVLHVYTGSHEDYHRPSDDWEKLNVEGMEKIGAFVAALAEKMGHKNTPLSFVRLPSAAARSDEADSGYGAYLGTVPDFAYAAGGVRLVGIQAGSPAQIAGLMASDVIIWVDETKVENLEDLATALRSRKPGDQVDIVVLRDGKRLTLKAVLGRRT